MTISIARRLAAEAVGTMALVAIVIGSGIMGEELSGGNDAIALLGNTVATGAGLIVLILIFGPVSGAHFNPAVTLAFALRRDVSPGVAVLYVAAQVFGGLTGTFLAHAMFGLDLLQAGVVDRQGFGILLGEAMATAGLILTILGTVRFRPEATPYAVGLFITAGYWFTSSTSFANPAVAIARSLTATFAGVRPVDAPAFILVELTAAAAATMFAGWLFAPVAAAYRPEDEGPPTAISRARP